MRSLEVCRSYRIDKIQFQGAADGFPLDDVIVHATSFAGDAAVLEMLAKHRVTFSPGDTVFHKVARQINDALKAGKLDGPHSAVGIATAQGSRQTDGAYQEVLSWARHSESVEAFFHLSFAGPTALPLAILSGTETPTGNEFATMGR